MNEPSILRNSTQLHLLSYLYIMRHEMKCISSIRAIATSFLGDEGGQSFESCRVVASYSGHGALSVCLSVLVMEHLKHINTNTKITEEEQNQP